jgi:hypothetical protein
LPGEVELRNGFRYGGGVLIGGRHVNRVFSHAAVKGKKDPHAKTAPGKSIRNAKSAPEAPDPVIWKLRWNALFLGQLGANGDSIVWIDGALFFFNVLDDALFVDDEGGALGPLKFVTLNVVRLQDAILLQDFATHVAEQREGDADFLGEGFVSRRAVDTDSENYRVRSFEFGHISLICLKFLRSTTGESEDVESEYDIFLAAVVGEVNLFPVIVEQGEVWGHVAGFQIGVIDLFVFLGGGAALG